MFCANHWTKSAGGTLIDHLISCSSHNYFTVISEFPYSDHNLTLAISANKYNDQNITHKCETYRNKKTYSPDKLKAGLSNIDWTALEFMSDVNEMISYFELNFLNVLNEIAPVKSKRVKVHDGQTRPDNSKSWMSDEIKQHIIEKKSSFQSLLSEQRSIIV
jgi:hypothetical protein